MKNRRPCSSRRRAVIYGHGISKSPQLGGCLAPRHPRHDHLGATSFRDASPVAGSGFSPYARGAEFSGRLRVIFARCSCTETSFGAAMPKGSHILPPRSHPPQQGCLAKSAWSAIPDGPQTRCEQIGKTVTADRDARGRRRIAPPTRVAGEMLPKLASTRRGTMPCWGLQPVDVTTHHHPTMPAARANSVHSGNRSSRSPISAGARPRSSATALG